MSKSRRVAWIALAFAVATALPRGADAQYFGQNKVQYRRYQWQSITSDHFEVYFYTGLDSLARRTLDLAEKTNAMLVVRMGHTLRRRVPIILYGSHNDFSQTNVTPELIDAGTGGFTEALRNRVVLPFSGSYEDLRHVVVHELTHAFMFDMVYGGSAASLIASQSFFSVPLWFAEGLAEYYSLGMESNAEMFLRDGAVAGYLAPLQHAGGYLVYKQGQSALAYLVERHGEDRLRDLFQRLRVTRNFDHAFQRSMGLSVARFDEQWRTWLRKTYWPTVATKENPEEFARRLTDHRHDESSLNTSPSVSPRGDRIAYFSDRRQYTDVYLMSALDGKVIRRVIRGERNVKFESIPSFRSAITWSPDGSVLGLTAKSAGRDVLYLVSATRGRVVKRLDIDADALYYPAWSPVSDSLVVVGVKDGRSDLWLVDTGSAQVTRLTDDTWDEKEPAWTPDGRTVTFSSDRLAPVVLHPRRLERGFGSYGLFNLDLASGQVTQLLDTHGDDHSPAWSPDGRKLVFITDRSGTPNICLYDLADSSITQLTDVLGGVSSLSWSRENDRLVFSAFNRGGFDVFAVKEPLSIDAVVARLRRQSPQAVLSLATAAREAERDSSSPRPTHGALAGAWPETLTTGTDTLRTVHPTDEGPVTMGGHADSSRVTAERPFEPPPWSGGRYHPYPALRDTLPRLAERAPLVERGGPFALPDSVLNQPPARYKVKLAPDFAGGGFYAASSFGLVGSTQFLLSDFLGDRSLYIATDVFSSSLQETNALVLYNYLPRRWDFGGGLFHFKNYYSSRVTSLGDALGSPRLFSERNFGALFNASYPFDRFRRMELSLTQLFAELRFYDPEFGTALERKFQSVTSPSVALVGDNALYGYFGPVNGHRYNLTFSPSLAVFSNGLSYRTVTVDIRHYFDLTHGYTFAVRGLGGYSSGRDPRTFFVGGYSTMRGFDDFSLEGQRVAVGNVEFRFPFIQQLGLVGPVPLGVFNLRGVVFADFGAVWDPGDKVQLSVISHVGGDNTLPVSHNVGTFKGGAFSYGAGIRTAIYFFIVKVDAAWNTDFRTSSNPHWHFSIGPEF
jgi:Tol biopolymer transport system component